MTKPMEGIRILEVAEHTFVPAASAMLSDLGAEVIKIEPIERGDAMRGLASTGVALVPKDIHVLLHHSNRGKKSLALDLTKDEGLELLYKLAGTADVFLTNKLPSVRKKLKVDVEQIRAANPNIIYVRGTGQGERGPDADKGSYDNLAFWARSGVAMAVTQTDAEFVTFPPGPGFGDSIGAMTIAGSIAMALLHRERTGEATEVDVSLLSSAMWAMGQTIGLSVLLEQGWAAPPRDMPKMNPLVDYYLTKDNRWIAMNSMQAGKYWPEFVTLAGRPELATDERFKDHASIMANTAEAGLFVKEIFASHDLAEWRTILEPFSGQWAVIQNTLEVASDAQTLANGYLQDLETEKGAPFQLVAAPMQFDNEPAPAQRAPEFNEHGDDILAELGLDFDAILDLKVQGVVG